MKLDRVMEDKNKKMEWTVNLKSFEIRMIKIDNLRLKKWTVNLKSFEIKILKNLRYLRLLMNCKLEKFWNILNQENEIISELWTVNLKSFEISARICNIPIFI